MTSRRRLPRGSAVVIAAVAVLVAIVSSPVAAVPSSTTRTSAVTTIVAAPTTTTTRDPCSAATHPCTCASSHAECAWLSFGSGGGRCEARAGASIDCGLCPAQEKCTASSPCAAFLEACSCTLTAGCAWNTGRRTCLPGSWLAPCSVCPRQSSCQRSKPIVKGFVPQHGGRGSGVNEVLQVQFSKDVKWCDTNAAHLVSFWCDGSLDQTLGAASLTIVTTALKVDISYALKGLKRTIDRKCGLEMVADLICDQSTSAPFAGIPRGAYSFTLTDADAPTVTSITPRDGASQVEPNAVIQFKFNEPIVLGPSTLFVTLSTLDTDRQGATSVVSNRVYPLQIPHVTTKGDSILQFDMTGKASAGWLYSISVPPGSVLDLSGNRFRGLAGGRYTFRVASAISRSGSSDDGGSDTGTTVFIVALVVGVLVGGIIVAAMVWKFQSGFVKNSYRHKEISEREIAPRSTSVNVPPGFQSQADRAEPSSQPGGAQFNFVAGPSNPNKHGGAQSSAQAGERVTWARHAGGSAPATASAKTTPTQPTSSGPSRVYPNTSSEPEPRRTSQNSKPPTGPTPGGRTSSSEPHSAFASRPHGSAASKAAPGPTSKPGPSAASKPSVPPVPENSCPEIRKVEKKLRDMMNEPFEVRKKLMKDLMLEYHPDKNSSDTAKEVFQFINSSKGWFLHDA